MLSNGEIYSFRNTTPAYQLNWSVSLFGKEALPATSYWLSQLAAATTSDDVRILEFFAPQPNIGQFLVSTRPPVSPADIVRSLKGRLQHQIRAQSPRAFRRNYFISSVGEASCRVLDQYVAKQCERHPMADIRVQTKLKNLQFHDPKINLVRPINGAAGQFVYAMQVVVEAAMGWSESRSDVLANSRAAIERTAAMKRWRLSRIGLLSNHIHLLLGAHVSESPSEVALSLMNELASVHGARPILRHSYYVGTFGSYDRSGIRRRL